MKADYQLRHQMHGKIGSFWSMQVDHKTKERVGTVVSASSAAPQLQMLDLLAGRVTNSRLVQVNDVSFKFLDGDFAYVGTDFEAYTRLKVGSLSFARRDLVNPGLSSSTAPRHHVLHTRSYDFVATPGRSFNSSCNWYLIPVPAGLAPIVIASRIADVYLVSGIDFTAHDGYIAMKENPAEVLPAGDVRVLSATIDSGVYNSFVMGAPDSRCGNRRLSDYARKSQSIRAFRLAAAEYVGMYIFDHDDLVLKVIPGYSTNTYLMARAGAVTVDYPHWPMSPGTAVTAGHVVSQRFDFIELRNKPLGSLEDAVFASGASVSLDYVLPVKGLSWIPGTPVSVDYVETGYRGAPHARMHLEGPTTDLQSLWDIQKLHELSTHNYLSYQLDLSAETGTVLVDMGKFLETYYNNFLTVIVADELPLTMQSRLMKFLAEHKPTTCSLLYAKKV